METLFLEKPPWSQVVWVQSPFWTGAPAPNWGPWNSVVNEEALRVKTAIGDLDREHKWELAKKMVNTYELVYTNSDDRLPPSVCIYQPLSRSYFKMIEILSVLQFFQRASQKLRTAHIAEGPGGFIQACIQQAEESGKQVQASYAMTLKPTTMHVPGWKKAAAFLLKYKQVKVSFGADGTGDVYKSENQNAFVSVVSPGVNLFTADGGFDFSVDYSQQEQKVFHLLLCSAMVGLQTLRTGGAFILKLFDLNTIHTQILIWFLGRHFDEWTLYRPAITRPCNSERYFLGRGFRGFSAGAREFLKTILLNSQSGTYPMYPDTFWTQRERAFIAAHIEKTTALQILSIKTAIELSKAPEEWRTKWYSKALDRAYAWCSTFRIPSRARL